MSNQIPQNGVTASKEKVLQKDLILSLRQHGVITHILCSAPTALNLIAHIRVLAYSDIALTVKLHKPNNGFQYLRHERLPPAVEQLANLARDAFITASNKMQEIRLLAESLFGAGGVAMEIFGYLNSPRRAKSLPAAMGSLQKGVIECAAKVKLIKDQFDSLHLLAYELQLAMSEEVALTADRERKTEQQIILERAEQQRKEKESIRLQQEHDALDADVAHARRLYNKALKGRGTLRTLAKRTLADIESSFFNLVGTATDIMRENPNIINNAIHAAAAGASGQRVGISHVETKAPSPRPSTTVREPSEAQPPVQEQFDHLVLSKAETFYTALARLKFLIMEYLPEASPEETQDEMAQCVDKIKSLCEILGGHTGKQAERARRMLQNGVEVGSEVLAITSMGKKISNKDWAKKIAAWSQRIEDVLNEATAFRAAQNVQAGSAFGNVPAVSKGLSSYETLLRDKHARLEMSRQAMESVKADAATNAERVRAAQRRVAELAARLTQLKHDEVTLPQIKKILKEAIQQITYLQLEITNLMQYFEGLARSLELVCARKADAFIRAIENGIDDDPRSPISCTQIEAKQIVDTLIIGRAHFTIVNDVCLRYQHISTEYIEPCMRMVCTISIAAPPEEQEKSKAKVQQFVEDATQSITQMALEERENLERDLALRIIDITDEIKDLPELPYQQQQAIQDGVREGRALKNEQTAGTSDPVQGDDIFDW